MGIFSLGKIKDFFSKNTINDATVLVLVNAVYFKAKWDRCFDYKHTVEADFVLNQVLDLISGFSR